MTKHDLHLHTHHSDGTESIQDMICAGVAMRLEVMGFSDHYIEGKHNWIDAFFKELNQCRFRDSIRILCGAEVRILRDGTLSIMEENIARLDFLLAEVDLPSFTVGEKMSKKEALNSLMEMMSAAAVNKNVTAFAHPFNWGRLAHGISPGDIDRPALKELARLFATNDKYFEIMGNMWFWYPDIHPVEFTGMYREIVEIFASENVKFCLGSDAHNIGGVGNLAWSLEMVKSCGIERLIIDPCIKYNI